MVLFVQTSFRLFSCPIRLTLGSYGFPDNGTQIIEKTADGAKAIILKGHDHTGREKQMAMTIYDGWDELEIVKSTGTNPDSENSIVIYAKTAREKKYGYQRMYLFHRLSQRKVLRISQTMRFSQLKKYIIQIQRSAEATAL